MTSGLSDSPQQLAREILQMRIDSYSNDLGDRDKSQHDRALIKAEMRNSKFNRVKSRLQNFSKSYNEHKMVPPDLNANVLIPGLDNPFNVLTGTLNLIAAKGRLSNTAKNGPNGIALSYAIPLVNTWSVPIKDQYSYFTNRLEFFQGFDEQKMRDGDVDELNRLAKAFHFSGFFNENPYEPKDFFTPYDIQKLLQLRKAFLDNDPSTIKEFEEQVQKVRDYVKPRLKKLGELLGVQMHTEFPAQPDLAELSAAILNTKMNADMTFGQFLQEAASWKWNELPFMGALRNAMDRSDADQSALEERIKTPAFKSTISNAFPGTKLSLETLHSTLNRFSNHQQPLVVERTNAVLRDCVNGLRVKSWGRPLPFDKAMSGGLLDTLAKALEAKEKTSEAQILRQVIMPQMKLFVGAYAHTLPHDFDGRAAR